jgi:hypothetical protein
MSPRDDLKTIIHLAMNASRKFHNFRVSPFVTHVDETLCFHYRSPSQYQDLSTR